jgi:hypothetical protein
MAHSTPPTSAHDERLPEAPLDRIESEPTWVADDLHLVRLVCQLTDYEVAGTTTDDSGIAAFGIGDRPRAPRLHDRPPGQEV